jgi:hydroxymethylpyrimidine/phosphomethylpyrimidine kinase
MQNKAYRINMFSEVKDNDKKTFTHTGVYSFEDIVCSVELNYDENKEINALEGHIVEAYFTCAITNFKPLTVIFEPVLVDPLIKNNTIEYFQTKEEAFKYAIYNVKELIKLKLTDKKINSDEMITILNEYSEDLVNKYVKAIKETNPPCSGNKIIFDNYHKLVTNLFTLPSQCG